MNRSFLKKTLPYLYTFITLAVIVAMIPKYAYNDPDTFWHIELGGYMLDHGEVLHHAIHTFYHDKLPYIPHEFGFQIIIALLYRTFGWAGTYLLTAFCLFMLILGLYRLTRVSRKEMGMTQQHALLFLFVLAVSCFIYYNYFTTRPQMISSFLIIWFFVFLREFMMRPRARYAALMTLISLAIANVHAGVWPVIAVFTVMAAVEALFEKKWSRRLLITVFAIFAAGFVNVGGAQNLLYIFTVTHNNFNLMISEWQPVYFANPLDLRTIMLLLFALLLPFVLHKKVFRFMFMLGILFLGISSYKMNLFMWLFVPYFAGTITEVIPYLKQWDMPFKRKYLVLGVLLGLFINIILVFSYTPKPDPIKYPVDEMTYILQQTPAGTRPKVLAKYGSSGYVMYRGGDVLCDGRQDPFTTDESKGVFGWTAFERSMKGFSINLPDIVAYDKPDYVIAANNMSGSLMTEWTDHFGSPVYHGRYGSVYIIHKKGA